MNIPFAQQPLGGRRESSTAASAHRSTAAGRVRGLSTSVTWVLLSGLVSLQAILLGGSASRRERERGDVPGWVLITLMTAGLVTAIWALASDQLSTVFTNAIKSVKAP